MAAALAVLPPHLASAAENADKPAASQPTEKSLAETRAAFISDVCERLAAAAQASSLPPGFLARLIWKESRFDPGAVSPKGAQGIAQFMPGTADERGLEDPFDPRSAIPASANYLAELRDEFGNLGLAASAYNAGPNRVRNWLSGQAGLPAETQDYVLSITGYPAADWSRAEPPKPEFALDTKLPFLDACRNLPVRSTKRPPVRYASASRQPWGVTLTADWSPTGALSRYAEIQRKYSGVLGGIQPMVLRVINYSWGTAPRFEVRIGQPDRAAANAFCQKLRKAGGICLVEKTQ